MSLEFFKFTFIDFDDKRKIYATVALKVSSCSNFLRNHNCDNESSYRWLD
jgi:hypothetical protein